MWNMRGKKFGELQEKFWNGYFCRIYMRQIDGYFAGFSGLQCLLEISYKDDWEVDFKHNIRVIEIELGISQDARTCFYN
jgi:hypothetical protein